MSEGISRRPVDWTIVAVAVVIFAVLGGVVGYLVTLTMDEQFGARVEFEYPIGEGAPAGFLREDRNLTTQVVLLGSRSVLEPVAEANGLDYEALAERTSAAVVSTSEIVRLQVRHEDGATATKLAGEIADRYLADANGATNRNLAFLRSQVTAVQRSIAATDSPEVRQGLIEHRVDLQAQLNAIRLAGPNARILDSAYLLDEPVSPNRPLAAAAGALAALIIGALIAAVLARRGSVAAVLDRNQSPNR